MFIKREISKTIESKKNKNFILFITGPKESGKSTLAKSIFKNHTYLDIQNTDLLNSANKNPSNFLNHHKNKHGLIINQAQYSPKLVLQIQIEANESSQYTEYYILLGSQSLLLHKQTKQIQYNILPLSIKELKDSNLLAENAETHILKGFYPKAYLPNTDINKYYQDYISDYIQNIESVKNLENKSKFKNFIELCALNIGQTLNISYLAKKCKMGTNTIKKWLQLLENTFILFLLPPYHGTLVKSTIKAPKIYFYDVGLAAAAMDIKTETLSNKSNIHGALFENMIIADIIKNIYNYNKQANLSFYRDNKKKEIDLIIEIQNKTIPIEIKSSKNILSKYFRVLEHFTNKTNNQEQPIVIYGGNNNQTLPQGKVISWKDIDIDLF